EYPDAPLVVVDDGLTALASEGDEVDGTVGAREFRPPLGRDRNAHRTTAEARCLERPARAGAERRRGDPEVVARGLGRGARHVAFVRDRQGGHGWPYRTGARGRQDGWLPGHGRLCYESSSWTSHRRRHPRRSRLSSANPPPSTSTSAP